MFFINFGVLLPKLLIAILDFVLQESVESGGKRKYQVSVKSDLGPIKVILLDNGPDVSSHRTLLTVC